ncbi:putative ribonuclease H-like domain-containing protein [Tanacetum coccineum]
MQRERAAQEEASNAALIAEFDDVQARMDADALLAARLQEEERDSFSIDEQARFLVEIIAKRKRFTYNQLKNKSLEEIKKLYEREQKWINDFIPMDSEMVKDSGKKDDDRDDIAINVESLATKYPIADWKTHILTKNMMYYQTVRADGSYKNYKIFSKMLDDFDRQDVVDLYSLVKERVHVLLMDTRVAIHKMIHQGIEGINIYNNFKIVEQEVKGTASSSSSLNSQNMAFFSSSSNTNEVNTAYGVSPANTQVSPAISQVSTASTQVSNANLSDDTVYAFLANQPNRSQIVYEDLEQIHEDDIEEIDLKWQLALLSMRTRRTVNVEETSSKAMVAIDGAGFDWSYMADEKVPTNMALMDFSYSKFNLALINKRVSIYSEISMLKSELEKLKQEKESNQLIIENFDNASKSLDKLLGSQITNKGRKGVGFVSYNVVPPPPPTRLFSPLNFDLSNSGLEEFQQPEFEGYRPKTSKSVSEDISNEVREYHDAPLVKELVSDDKLEKKNVFPTVAKIEFTSSNLMEDMLPLGEEPKEGKLLAKGLLKLAILDESMLWHRRLGHEKFKTINKIVKENLMRGLLGKRFENDQTCVACLKGKQHKASCKSKIQNSITQPLFMLHMDLFGPTFVSSLMNKKYCLVVTDDYRRFTWVFFLASKDETSCFFKRFINEIENLVDKKVKIIRCDNGTKFKNRVMSEFCKEKGIKKEFSVARTPQQNGVTERRNRTLIEAARTMITSANIVPPKKTTSHSVETQKPELKVYSRKPKNVKNIESKNANHSKPNYTWGSNATYIPSSISLVMTGPVTTKENVQKKKDVKAGSMLLMALPNEHLMTFNQYKDAKTLFASIQTRFGSSEAIKKT